jgi:hypothetical protein
MRPDQLRIWQATTAIAQFDCAIDFLGAGGAHINSADSLEGDDSPSKLAS